jgi:hypothetical protein
MLVEGQECLLIKRFRMLRTYIYYAVIAIMRRRHHKESDVCTTGCFGTSTSQRIKRSCYHIKMLLERRQRALELFDKMMQKGLATAPSVSGSGSEIVLALPHSRFLPTMMNLCSSTIHRDEQGHHYNLSFRIASRQVSRRLIY